MLADVGRGPKSLCLPQYLGPSGYYKLPKRGGSKSLRLPQYLRPVGYKVLKSRGTNLATRSPTQVSQMRHARSERSRGVATEEEGREYRCKRD